MQFNLWSLCFPAQPVGAPEISKKSLSQSSPAGGDEMFIIGKNFMKGTVVVFEEVRNDRVVWTSEADIDQDFFQTVSCHDNKKIARVPKDHIDQNQTTLKHDPSQQYLISKIFAV